MGRRLPTGRSLPAFFMRAKSDKSGNLKSFSEKYDNDYALFSERDGKTSAYGRRKVYPVADK